MTRGINCPRGCGFTLVELMTAIVIFSLLTMLAIPMYQSFIANTQIRTATESLLHGLRRAQTEAIKQNGRVDFVLDEQTGWQVRRSEDDTLLDQVEFRDGSPKVLVTATGRARRVTFDSLGRIVCQPAGEEANPLVAIDVTSSMVQKPRSLRVLIGNGAAKCDAGRQHGTSALLRACDVKLPADDPAGCPAPAS